MKIMIIGGGKLGYKLAEALSGNDEDVTLIDSNSEVLAKMRDHLDILMIKADGRQIEALKEADISSYDLMIAVTETDETNMVICALAKELGCPKAIARVRNPEYARHGEFIKPLFKIDYIVNPELAIANEITKYLIKSYSFYSDDFAEGRVLMADFNSSSLPGFAGKKIMDLENIEDILIVAISRDGEIIIPSGSTQILEEDFMYIIGNNKAIDQLAQRSRVPLFVKDIRKVMILGGGKIGYYLAEKLGEHGISVKIIEKIRERCQVLSENLKNTLVICGDGTDTDLLMEEDLASTDAFIGVTGHDEENLLMTLTAKQSGVKKAIAKVSRPAYISIIERLGVDVALNPVDITVGNILKFIRGGRAISVSLLLGGQAEVTEILADENMTITGMPIAKLGLPKGIIIGAIYHEGEVSIPKGSSIIYPGDRFVVFCLSSEINVLERFFKGSKRRVFSGIANRTKGIR